MKKSAPSCGFGTSPRFGTERQFLSKDHSKQLNCPTWTPGPGNYVATSSVGRQASSESKTHASFGFGTSSRFNHEKNLAKKSRTLPAPGAYKATSALGRQVMSTKGSSNNVPFGSSSRAHVVVEKGFEQAFFGMESPGPAMYRNGKGFFSKNKEELSLLGPSFGKDPRAIDPNKPNDLERRSAAVPGPGMYPTGSSMVQHGAPGQLLLPFQAAIRVAVAEGINAVEGREGRWFGREGARGGYAADGPAHGDEEGNLAGWPDNLRAPHRLCLLLWEPVPLPYVPRYLLSGTRARLLHHLGRGGGPRLKQR